MKSPNHDTLEYLNGKKKLTNTELEYMQIIWSHPDGISSEAIYRHFTQAPGTKGAILYKISEKGYVHSVQKGRHHWYYPTITKLEYEQALLKQQLKNSMGYDSFGDLIAAFCGKKQLSKTQLDRIENFLEELEHEDSGK